MGRAGRVGARWGCWVGRAGRVGVRWGRWAGRAGRVGVRRVAGRAGLDGLGSAGVARRAGLDGLGSAGIAAAGAGWTGWRSAGIARRAGLDRRRAWVARVAWEAGRVARENRIQGRAATARAGKERLERLRSSRIAGEAGAAWVAGKARAAGEPREAGAAARVAGEARAAARVAGEAWAAGEPREAGAAARVAGEAGAAARVAGKTGTAGKAGAAGEARLERRSAASGHEGLERHGPGEPLRRQGGLERRDRLPDPLARQCGLDRDLPLARDPLAGPARRARADGRLRHPARGRQDGTRLVEVEARASRLDVRRRRAGEGRRAVAQPRDQIAQHAHLARREGARVGRCSLEGLPEGTSRVCGHGSSRDRRAAVVDDVRVRLASRLGAVHPSLEASPGAGAGAQAAASVWIERSADAAARFTVLVWHCADRR